MATLAQTPGSIAIEADSVFLPFVFWRCHADLVRHEPRNKQQLVGGDIVDYACNVRFMDNWFAFAEEACHVLRGQLLLYWKRGHV